MDGWRLIVPMLCFLSQAVLQNVALCSDIIFIIGLFNDHAR